MPITLIDILKQSNRDPTTGDFFFLLDSGDINFKIQGIQEDATLNPTLTKDNKYILEDVSALNVNFGTITGVGDNDIVRYNGTAFEIFLDASNKQDGTIVFNEGDSKFYGFNGTAWQELGSGAGGGATLAAGAGVTLSPIVAGVGYTLGIDPTAAIHVAGISSDGGITASGRVFGESVSVDGHLLVKDGSQLQIKPSGSLVTAIDGNGIYTFGRYYATTYVQSGSYVHAGTGVSLDAGGITFPDGTFQSTASSGVEGTTGATGATGTSVGFTSGNTAPSGSNTGDFWYENDTGLYYANVYDGSTLAWLQVSGRPGPTGQQGPAGAGSGGSTLSAGDGLTLSQNVAGVGYTMSVDFNGAATNQVLYHDGTGFSGDNSVLFAQDANHPHLETDIEGKLLKAIKADEALAALDPVYITGNVGASDRVTVGKADASDSAKMPAAGIVTGAFSTNDEGYMVVTGLVRDADTSGFTANDTAFVGVGGGITAARPSGATDLIQNLGRIGRVHASTGTLLVLGAGRANDTPNLIHARAGISSDAGITAAGRIVNTKGVVQSITNVNSRYGYVGSDSSFEVYTNNNDVRMSVNSQGIQTSTSGGQSGRIYAAGYLESVGVVKAGTGVSLDAGGITFPDGTFQSSAASGSGVTAGAGMVLTGSTLGIDPTAVIHVAGVSSDGGITAAGDVFASNRISVNGHELFRNGSQLKFDINNQGGHISFGEYGSGIFDHYLKSGSYVQAGTGVSLDAGGITFPDGTYQASAASGSGATGADGTSVGYTAGNTAPVGSATGDFWYENDTGLYYANVFDGTTLGWLQISGIDGVTGPAGAGGGGGTTLAAGAGMTLSTTVAGVGHTLGIDPTAAIHVAGISSDGGITVGNLHIDGYTILDPSNTTDFLTLGANKAEFYQNNDRMLKINGSTSVIVGSSSDPKSLQVFGTQSISDLLTTSAGISLGNGITFPDGTFQSSAATTSASGVDSVNGLTGGVTFNAGTNMTISAGAGGITLDAAGGGPSVTIVGVTGGPTAGWIAAADVGDFWVEIN